MSSRDETQILQADLDSHHIEGFAIHGGKFSCPLISFIGGNLYTGGCIAGVPLPSNIEHVVSLYPWEQYAYHDHVKSILTVPLYDSLDSLDETFLWAIAAHAHRMCGLGPTLIHCQAGLNRSGMIAALALVLHGKSPQDAIECLRKHRSDQVLCNSSFANFVLNCKKPV